MEYVVLILGLSLFSSLCVTATALMRNKRDKDIEEELEELREWKQKKRKEK